jgi:alkylated DNA repair dioxygenase AlkB
MIIRNVMKELMERSIRTIHPKYLNHPNLNACLGNRYHNGHQNIGAHSDSESDLHDNALIVSVSLGATRDFIFTHKVTKKKGENYTSSR